VQIDDHFLICPKWPIPHWRHRDLNLRSLGTRERRVPHSAAPKYTAERDFAPKSISALHLEIMPAETKPRASGKKNGRTKGRNALKLECDDGFESHNTNMEEDDDDDETSGPE
jgi:hypothetical protein